MKTSNNLWVFNHFASTPKTNTGAGERHYFLAEQFKEHGWQTTVFSAAYNHLFLNQPKRSFPFHVESFGDYLRFVWVWVVKYDPKSGLGRLLNWLSFVFTLFLIPKKRFGKPDIIIVSSMSMWPIFNALWCRLWHRNVKIIFEIRDIWPLTPVEIGGISRNNPVIRLMFGIEKMAYNRSNHVVSVLPNADQRLQEVLGNRSFNFTWIPNASIPDLADISNEHSITRRYKTIIYAGAIGPANSLDTLIDIANCLKDSNIRFEIIGDGPDKIRLKKKVDELSLENVLFRGKVSKALLKSYLIKADALFIAWRDISLYKYGVSANKYNDYMALGKPIISIGDISKDPVEISGCGLVVKDSSPKKASQKIHSFLKQNDETLQAIGNKGRDYWRRNKIYPVVGKKYIELFNKILNE